MSSQSKPLIPGLKLQPIKKKIIVNGAKIANRRGQIHISNANRNKAGLISHHINMARRGPKSRKIVVAQHILFYPLDKKFFKRSNSNCQKQRNAFY